MCGIVGAVSNRNITQILVEGLKRLEYRGYDSAGVALIDESNTLETIKVVGKVAALEAEIDARTGRTGIAHTRWATHGKPTQLNAHPHTSGSISMVHNGIIENHEDIRAQLVAKGYKFVSNTDSEVIAHLYHQVRANTSSAKEAILTVCAQLHGAYAIAVVDQQEPNKLLVARQDMPLLIGIGIDENYIASDTSALRQVTDRFIYLDDGEFAEITTQECTLFDASGAVIEREIERASDQLDVADKGSYRHFMIKEIFDQPSALKNTFTGRITHDHIVDQAFGANAMEIFDRVDSVQITACGTSYHAGLVAKYWFEEWAGIQCHVDIASEYRYRANVVRDNTLFVTISQSGQTADTLAALGKAKTQNYLAHLAICNVPNSMLVRESDLVLLTQAGIEIGVASTKAFTTQLIALQLLVAALGKRRGMSKELEQELMQALIDLPVYAAAVLQLNNLIQTISNQFTEKHHALFLGRGVHYPIALEGALKIKEISYIHAEAYPSGELKHGPLALVDSDMPVVAVAPSGDLLGKIKSNLEEVAARGGKLYVFADENAGFRNDDQTTVINIPHCPESISPIIYTLPLQLLAYHVAVNKGTDVDQPRNLAKSVTVE
jgi:glucosamine--fructose-6-phosphate aminotransferase (isomerizing)